MLSVRLLADIFGLTYLHRPFVAFDAKTAPAAKCETFYNPSHGQTVYGPEHANLPRHTVQLPPFSVCGWSWDQVVRFVSATPDGHVCEWPRGSVSPFLWRTHVLYPDQHAAVTRSIRESLHSSPAFCATDFKRPDDPRVVSVSCYVRGWLDGNGETDPQEVWYAQHQLRRQLYSRAVSRISAEQHGRRLDVTAYTQGPKSVCDDMPVGRCCVVSDFDTPALLQATKSLILSDYAVLGFGCFSSLIAFYRQSPATTFCDPAFLVKFYSTAT